MPWFQDDLGVVRPEFQAGRASRERLQVSTRLTDASASSRAVFSESDRRSVDCSGSKGGPFKALSTVGRSHVGTVRGRGGFNLLAPFRKWTTELSLPTDWPAIGA